MAGIDTALRFTRMLSDDGQVGIEKFKSAAARYATDYNLARLVLETHLHEGPPTENPDGRPVVTNEIVLYDNPDVTADPVSLDQRFIIDKDDYAVSHTYLIAGTERTPELTDEIELFSTISYFYFGRMRFAEMMKLGALTQYMTGLPNSGGYMAKVSEFFGRGILINYDAFHFNLKGFGLISKKYGFKQGDDLIRQYARYVAAFADDEEIIAHLGGDNFVALIKKSRYSAFISMLQDVHVKARRGDGQEDDVRLECTVGIWHIDKEIGDLSEVISLPAIAMNAAKNVLHQPICHVSDELLFQVSEQKRVLERFPAAIRSQEFLVYYQPKVDTRGNILAGAEALVRWMHDGEMIPPAAFIPVLEREGAIRALDLYVLEHACIDIRKWEKMGLTPVTVSVNISRKDLDDHTLPFQICDIIDRYEVDHKYIQIEITETTDDTEHGIMIEFLNKLCEMGISTAIDDFGSGYSSLSTLRNFKINTLKIDRSFIDNEVFSASDEIILSDIIHMAERLGVEVITEGVERKDQLEFMQKVGCFLIQGYYFDKPLPVEAFTERLKIGKYDI